jgi:hypothetical protein
MIGRNLNEATQALRNVAELVALLASRRLAAITFILQGKLAAFQESFLRFGRKASDHLTRRREPPGKKTDCLGITTDRAFVVSMHDDGCQGMLCQGTLHINLKWHGNHNITDFDLDQLGKVIQCETETETSGWVVVQQSGLVSAGYAVPLRRLSPG